MLRQLQQTLLTTSVSTRAAAVLLLLGLFGGGSGCVVPGEFDDSDNACGEGRFDALSRDAYCSGSWSSRAVSVDGLVRDDAVSKPLVHIQGDWLTTVQAIEEGRSVDVKVFKKDLAGRYLPELSRTLSLPADAVGDLTSAVMMGLSADRPVEESVLALVQDRRELMLLDINSTSSFSGSDSVLLREDNIERLLQGADGSWVDPSIEDGCSTNAGGEREFADLAAFTPTQNTGDSRQYVVIAARCAMVVYGYEPNLLPPTQLVQLPTEAIDIEIDQNHERLLIASGLNGLKIRDLKDFEDTLDGHFINAITVMGAEAVGAPDNGTGGDDPSDFRNSFSPGFDPGAFAEVDPSLNAVLNVTQVGFSDDRVFFISEPTIREDEYSSLTYLVSGRLSADGAFEEKTSVPVANDDLEQEQVEWQLVSLKDTFFAVLRNVSRQTDAGQLGSQSQLKLFDAPLGQKPEEVFTIPTTTQVSTILEEEGELWVVQPDSIFAYDFNISGSSSN